MPVVRTHVLKKSKNFSTTVKCGHGKPVRLVYVQPRCWLFSVSQ